MRLFSRGLHVQSALWILGLNSSRFGLGGPGHRLGAMLRKGVEEMTENAYQITTPEHSCCCCEVEISPGSAFYSTVCFLGEEFARRNYCPSCWVPGEPAPGNPAPAATAGGGLQQENIFAYWRTRRPEDRHAEAVKIRFDPQLVLEFFRGLGKEAAAMEAGAEGDGAHSGPTGSQGRDLRFVLSLLLMRKKILLLDGTLIRDGFEWLQLHERVESDRTYEIANPDLSEGELEQVRDAIGELLHMQV